MPVVCSRVGEGLRGGHVHRDYRSQQPLAGAEKDQRFLSIKIQGHCGQAILSDGKTTQDLDFFAWNPERQHFRYLEEDVATLLVEGSGLENQRQAIDPYQSASEPVPPIKSFNPG